MSSVKTSPRSGAILVLDSRNSLLPTRNLSIHGSWSRLYKLGDHYLDLSLKSSPASATLLGKVVSPKGLLDGQVQLISEGGESVNNVPLSTVGMFSLQINQAGIYNLEMQLDTHKFVVCPVDVY